MTRFNCDETFRRLDDYVDRELDPAERAAVEAHLEVCAMCAAEFGLEREVLDDLRDKLRRISVPAGLRERISARLRRGP